MLSKLLVVLLRLTEPPDSKQYTFTVMLIGYDLFDLVVIPRGDIGFIMFSFFE
jgi:hypothetical protein